MNPSQVSILVAEVLGTEPCAVVPQTFGHNNVTYEAVLSGCSVIVRMNENALAFAATELNIAALAKLGLPVPKVLASDLTKTRYPFAYMTRLAEQIVDYQCRVMTLPPGAGYGYVGIGETGPYTSWWDLLCSDNRADCAHASDTVLDEYEARILHLVSRFETYFRQIIPVCFLDDITVKNVLIHDGELQGLIDFDCICYGDPLYWLALTATGVVSDVGMAELFYVDELKRLWGLTPEQDHVLALYSASMSLGFLRRSAAHETPEWKVRILNAIQQWLTICDN
jgi:aminoglycoside phosphotransferase (APT) family kinase protein